MSFNWTSDLITNEASEFVSIQWYGMLKAPLTEDFTFILSGDDGFRFYLNEELVIDRWDSCCDDMLYNIPLVKDTFYDIILQYK